MTSKRKTWYCFACRKWLPKIRFGEDPDERVCSNCIENRIYEERIRKRSSEMEEDEEDDE
jgi:hypothetical protein